MAKTWHKRSDGWRVMKRVWISLMLAGMFFPGPVMAQYQYLIRNGQVQILKYKGSARDVIVPGTIEGLPVTRIWTGAFKGKTQVADVRIPRGVTVLGMSAFEGCTNLKSVNVPAGITRIPYKTFFKCKSLVSIKLPRGVTNINDCAFEGCTGLRKINLPDTLLEIRYHAFAYAPITSIVIPASVKIIRDKAFKGCAGLKRVYFLGDKPRIGSDIFKMAPDVVVYRLKNSRGWGKSLSGRPVKIGAP